MIVYNDLTKIILNLSKKRAQIKCNQEMFVLKNVNEVVHLAIVM